MLEENFFSNLHTHSKELKKVQKIYDVMKTSLEIVDERFFSLSLLQKNYLIVETAYTYKHFGYSLLSKIGISLLAKGLALKSNISRQVIEYWLEQIRDFLKEEIISFFPDQDSVQNFLNEDFYEKIMKRIFISEENEDQSIGLGAFDEKMIQHIRNYSHQKTQQEVTSSQEWQTIFLSYGLHAHNIELQTQSLLQELKLDPLAFLVWRLEAFISPSQEVQQALCFLKHENADHPQRAKQMTALISLLIPHINQNGQSLLPQTPLSLNHVLKALKNPPQDFHLTHIKEWLSILNEDKQELKQHIQTIAQEALQCGLLFSVGDKNKECQYGLSERGLKIIMPFQKVITESMTINTH